MEQLRERQDWLPVIDEGYIIDEMSDDDEDHPSNEEDSEDTEAYFTETTMRRIGNDDPQLTKLVIDGQSLPQNRNWESDGAKISRNTHLKEVVVLNSAGLAQLPECFFFSLAMNESIERITCRDSYHNNLGSIFIAFIPFFKDSKNFECLTIERSRTQPESLRLLAYALHHFDSLREFRLVNCELDDDTNATSELIQGLARHPHLKKLILKGVPLGSEGGSASMATLLQDQGPKLTLLDLRNTNIGNTLAVALADLLAGKSLLKVLDLRGNRNISDTGWGAIFVAMQSKNCQLEKASLWVTAGVNTSLSDALTINKTIKTLNLRSNLSNIDASDWKTAFDFLQSPTCVLEDLSLRRFGINDDVLIYFSKSLTKNDSVKYLNLSHIIGDVTLTGWRALFAALQSPNSALETLNLSLNHVRDDALDALMIPLAKNTKLRFLNLADNYFTPNALRLFWIVLQSPNSALEQLNLRGTVINSGTMTSFAYALKNNDVLQELAFGRTNILVDSRVDISSWAVFTSILCNTSTIMDTYRSNHTLQTLGNGNDELLPNRLRSLLRLNREHTKSQAARLKILRYHFNGDNCSMHPFDDSDFLKVLPHGIAWLTNDCANVAEGRWGEGFGLLYRLLSRGVVPVFAGANGTDKKRKRDD